VPATLVEILREADGLLAPERFEDYCPNGLQVPGRAQVASIATGVSAHLELFGLAVDAGVDLLLVHHGIFWGSGPGPIDAQLKRRLKILFDADISLAAYHLPLDAHLDLGNNALLARAIGATDPRPFALHRGEPIGVLATLAGSRPRPGGGGPEPGGGGAEPGGDGGLPVQELFERVREATSREPLVFDRGPELVGRVAIVSGAGADYLANAAAAGAEAFITGEPAERSMAQAHESGLHFIAAGHYATETFGVRALGERLAQRFDLRHVFLDVPNPV
jgi:dinuclear metal center YbgI/SA1388 family protein